MPSVTKMRDGHAESSVSSARGSRGGTGPRISVIVPIYNEVESIPTLQQELATALGRIGAPFEIIYVDDGSDDGSVRVLADLGATRPECRVYRFHHNQGKASAYSVGFREARGSVLLTLDGDLQDDPAEIPGLLRALDAGHDLVVGRKVGRSRNEPLKKIPSWAFNRVKGWVFGLRLRDSNSGFRAMRAEVAQSVDLYAGNYRFLPELAHYHGFRVTEVPVRHRRRKHGKSKYGPTRFLSGVFDLLTLTLLAGFAHRPLHFFGSAGLIPLTLGFGLECYVLVAKLLGSQFQTHVGAMIIGVMLILLGIQLISIGLIGEFVLAQSRRARMRPPHHVPLHSSERGERESDPASEEESPLPVVTVSSAPVK